MVTLDPVVDRQRASTRCAEGTFHDLEQVRRLNAVFPRIPAAVRVPHPHPLQKYVERKFVVIRNGEPPSGCGVKAHQDRGVRIFELSFLPQAQQRGFELLLIVARLPRHLRLHAAQPAHGLGDGFALRVPAQKDTIA